MSGPVASVVGQRYGGRRYQVLGADKTYVGSAAFFTATLPLTLVFLSTTPLSITSIGVVPVLAAALTLVEGVSGGGVDNVVLPVVAAGLLMLAM